MGGKCTWFGSVICQTRSAADEEGRICPTELKRSIKTQFSFYTLLTTLAYWLCIFLWKILLPSPYFCEPFVADFSVLTHKKNVLPSSAWPSPLMQNLTGVRGQQVWVHTLLASFCSRAFKQKIDLNTTVFVKNDIAGAVKTRAPVPGRWHKLSRSGFLFVLIFLTISPMLTVCSVPGRHLRLQEAAQHIPPWQQMVWPGPSQLFGPLWVLLHFSLLCSEASWSETFLGDEEAVVAADGLYIHTHLSECPPVPSCSDFWTSACQAGEEVLFLAWGWQDSATSLLQRRCQQQKLGVLWEVQHHGLLNKTIRATWVC